MFAWWKRPIRRIVHAPHVLLIHRVTNVESVAYFHFTHQGWECKLDGRTIAGPSSTLQGAVDAVIGAHSQVYQLRIHLP